MILRRWVNSGKLIRQIDHYLAKSAAGIKCSANFHAGQLIGHVVTWSHAGRLLGWFAQSIAGLLLAYRPWSYATECVVRLGRNAFNCRMISSLLSYVDVAVRHTAGQDWTRNCQSQNKLASTDLTRRATCHQAFSFHYVSLYVRKTEQYKISCWRTHSISFSRDTAIIIWTLNRDSPRIHVECGDTGCSVNIHDITWLHNESSSAQLRA